MQTTTPSLTGIDQILLVREVVTDFLMEIYFVKKFKLFVFILVLLVFPKSYVPRGDVTRFKKKSIFWKTVMVLSFEENYLEDIM